jgi:hypothetical protein
MTPLLAARLNPTRKGESIMGWLKTLREARGDNAPTEAHRPWLTQLRDAAEAMAEQSDDPWALVLDNLRGHVVGGVERISTQEIYEKLGVRRNVQSGNTGRRLAIYMADRGWKSIRAHGLNPHGRFSTRVRGYARVADPAKRQPLI